MLRSRFSQTLGLRLQREQFAAYDLSVDDKDYGGASKDKEIRKTRRPKGARTGEAYRTAGHRDRESR